MGKNHFVAETLARSLMDAFGLNDWVFGWMRSKRKSGQCRPGRIELSIHLPDWNPPEVVENTIRHEIAHALAFLEDGEVGHGPAWVAACQRTGAIPSPVSDLVKLPPGRWRANCPSCMKEYSLHRKPRATSHYCPRCGPDSGRLIFRD